MAMASWDPPELRYLGVHLSGEHLGEPGTIASLRDHISRLRTSDVVQAATKLLQALEQVEHPSLPKLQPGLLSAFSEEQQARLSELLSRGRGQGGVDVLFYPQQLLAMQKLAVALGQPGPATSFNNGEDWQHFLLAAAQVGDVAAEFSPLPSPVLNFPDERMYAVHAFRAGWANRRAMYKQAGGRAYRMWIDPAPDLPPTVESPDQYCRRAFGVSLKTFIALGIAPALSRIIASPQQVLFNENQYFCDVDLQPETVSTIFDALTLAELPESAVEDEATYWCFTDLALTPYVSLHDGQARSLSSISHGFERPTTGIFWMLHTEYQGAVEEWTGAFGDVFEDYCARLLVSVADNATVAERERQYQRGGTSVLSSDVLLSTLSATGPARVFIECSTIRPARSVLASADLNAFDAYVNRIVKKLGQIERCIDDHRAGLFALHDDLAKSGDPYFPLLVVDEPFQWWFVMRNVIHRATTKEGLFQGVDVAQPVICSVGELEHLVSAVELGQNVADLLRSFLMADRAISLEAHLHEVAPPLDTPRLVSDGFSDLADMAVEELRALGLREGAG